VADNKTAHDLLHPANWPQPKGYANGIRARGTFVLTGGIIGWDETETLAEGFVAQTRQTLKNILAILREGGAGPEHLVRMTWYVCDMDEYLAARRDIGPVYLETIGSHFPAMALVAVTRLVEPGARLEIEATAVVP